LVKKKRGRARARSVAKYREGNSHRTIPASLYADGRFL
jgi:hypothetical protein